MGEGTKRAEGVEGTKGAEARSVHMAACLLYKAAVSNELRTQNECASEYGQLLEIMSLITSKKCGGDTSIRDTSSPNSGTARSQPQHTVQMNEQAPIRHFPNSSWIFQTAPGFKSRAHSSQPCGLGPRWRRQSIGSGEYQYHTFILVSAAQCITAPNIY